MLLRELKAMVESTADAAFAIDDAGTIIAWNQAATTLFGWSSEQAVGQVCGAILHGADECGQVCSSECSVRHAVQSSHHLRNFDLQLQTAGGRKWCNISVLAAEINGSMLPGSIHIVREIDTSKRLELAVRNFVTIESPASATESNTAATIHRSPLREVELTRRELEILQLMAKGKTTEAIARQLHISRTTVNNHIQHILGKLNAHTRLEAIRRAEHAGLIQ